MNDTNKPEKPGRDAKGLTLLGRTALRIVTEVTHVLHANARLHNRQGLAAEDLLCETTVAAEVMDLLVVASNMATKIGDVDEVREYLRQHREQDEKDLNQLSKEAAEVISKLMIPNTPKCTRCGQELCDDCGGCHTCVQKKHSTIN